MSTDQKGLEIKVGFFIFVGLLAIAIMAIEFGRVGQGFSKSYDLQVEFPNASGLLKNADVQLSGAVVGHVVDKPNIVPGQIGSVTVALQIKDTIKLPRGSTFRIGSSGLMGDKFVDIAPPDDFDPKSFNPNDPKQTLQAGEKIEGGEPKGIDAITKRGDEAMGKLNARLDELKTTIDMVNTRLPQVLSDTNIKNLQDTFVSIKAASDNFAEASKKINGIMDGAQTVVDTAGSTMDSAKTTMATANNAANDIRAAIGEMREGVRSAQTLLKAAMSGPGTIPMLLGNREVSDNLRALIANIRRHGVLFYHDTAQRDDAPDSSNSKVKRR